MLTEIPRTHQRPDEPRRRWFTSESMDLMLWLDDAGGLLAFQFSHGKPAEEKALSWSRERGLSSQRVEDGSLALPGHKGSPLLLAEPVTDTTAAASAFASANAHIPAPYAAQILQLLKDAGGSDHV